MKHLIFSMLLLVTITSYSQDVFKFRTTAVAVRSFKDYYNQWEEWGEWEESNVLVIMNMKNLSLEIYSKNHQQYDLLNVNPAEYHTDYKKTIAPAVDEDGLRCTVEFVTWNSGTVHIYIKWSDIQIVYELQKM